MPMIDDGKERKPNLKKVKDPNQRKGPKPSK
jgi:hypothetical protein